MNLEELQDAINKKRQELDQLVLIPSLDLCTGEILKMSQELDTLIAAYLKLTYSK
ncbi:MAG: Spo0E family sporulation regulatory protein-aspartic acid phosphatase [Clostridiales bacterium]|nr:Spo0E family sporulation regulatory protein-aspartic acid phosphatase [Clostridiales bacterium]